MKEASLNVNKIGYISNKSFCLSLRKVYYREGIGTFALVNLFKNELIVAMGKGELAEEMFKFGFENTIEATVNSAKKGKINGEGVQATIMLVILLTG